MNAVVVLRIAGQQVSVDSKSFLFTWTSPENADIPAFDDLLIETLVLFGQVYFPQMLASAIEVDEADSIDRIRATNLVQVLNALWWTAKEKGIRIVKVASKGVNFKFTEPDFSVDEFVR